MKPWTEEDLILFYYDELDDKEAQALTKALESNTKLKQQYEQLSTLLSSIGETEIPQPSADFNQRIMAGINRVDQAELNKDHIENVNKIENLERTQGDQISGWLSNRWHDFSTWVTAGSRNSRAGFSGGASIAMASIALLVVVTVFYLGRMSAGVAPNADQHLAKGSVATPASESLALSSEASRRILLSNVSTHLEAGSRLFTTVSNSAGSTEIDLSEREQMIEDLISFNRLYRQAAERSQDSHLALVLQQMERVLLQLHHVDIGGSGATNAQSLDKVRSRLDDSDLLFKMKVANKKIEQEFI